MSDKSWWQLLNDWIPTVQDVENTRRGVVDWAGGDGSVGGAIAKGITSPIKAGVDVTSALGGAIGGAAGMAGGYMSEAGQEAAARGDSRGELDSILSGARGGAEGGSEAARENINVLDVASLGAGALGSSAMRAAKLATQAGKLGKAASLAKGAGTLAKIDTGLSAVDAGIGATQVASGIKEGDWAEGLMGAARVAGNAYGAHNSLKDLGEVRGLRSIIDELGLKDTKAPNLGMVADRPPNMSDAEWADVQSADANKALDKGIKGLGIETTTEEGARILAEARSRTSPLEPSKIGFASKKSEAFFNAITNDTSNMLDLEKYFKQLDPAEQADLVQKLQDPDQMKFLGRPITEVDKNTKSANADAVRRLLGERALDQTPEQYGLMRAQDFLRRVAKDRPAALDPASYVPSRLMKASVRDGVVTEEWDDIARLRPDGATMSTVDRGKVAGSPNDEYTVEAVDRGGNRSRTTERDLERLANDPEYKGTHDEIAAYVRQLEEDLTESSIAQMSDIKWWQQGARNYPTQKLYQWAGKLRGFIHGGNDYGMTYLPGSKGRRYNEVGAGNAYWISPRNIAVHAKQIVDLAIEPGAIDPSMLGKLDSLFGEQEKIYLNMVRSGEIGRVPEFELQMKAKMTMEQLKYTAAHEALGHNHPQSDHFENYRTEIHDPESYGRGTSVGNLETEALDSFTLANNWLVKHMADPTQLKGIKAIESGPTFNDKRVKWYKQIMPEDDPGYTLKTEAPMSRKAGRTAGIDQIKAANEEFGVEGKVGDTPPTPPGSVPPGSTVEPDIVYPVKTSRGTFDTVVTDITKMVRGEEYVQVRTKPTGSEVSYIPEWVPRNELKSYMGDSGWTPPPNSVPPGSTPGGGEPFGPQLKPLAERIRTTLNENRKVNILNDQRTREVQNLKAQALQKIDDELMAGRMTHDESVIATKKVREGAFGLQETVDQLPITQAEKQMMTERLAQVQQADRQIRANNRIIWDKMLKGERLTQGEVKSITDALSISVEEAGKTPLIKRIFESGMNFIGGSRALMSSYDLSAAGRQALFASVMNPREAARAFKAQIDALRMTPAEFEKFMDTFDDPSLNPYRDLQKAAGLHISHQKGVDMREEAFLRASWAEKIPGVLRSEQAYIAYLNKMRVELFNKSVKQLTDSGVAIVDQEGIFNPIFQDVAYMVNTLTGRGEMSAVHISKGSGQGKLLGLNATVAPGADAMKNMHQGLTSVFFAPRFAASRAAILRDATLGMVGGNLEAPVYKMYMKNVYGTIGVMSSLAAAVVATGAGTFNADPSKKDFGVLRVGKVRYDLYGGLKPWAKLGLSLTQDTYADSKGRQKAYGSFGGKTHTSEIGRFIQGKLSPPVSLLLEAVTGEDFMGNKSTAFNKAYSHFTPMILQTITEAIAEGEAEQLPLAVPAAVLGIGVNTYGDRRSR